MDLRALRAPLDAAALSAAVARSGWRTLYVVESVGSTNADLISRAAAGGDIAGVVLIAEHQTAGRGRRGRRWAGAPGAQLIVSCGVAAHGVEASTWGWLPLAAGVAVIDTVALAGVQASLKWPNDVLAGSPRRKLAGILAEVTAHNTVIVVGIGLNVTLRQDEIGDEHSVCLTELGVASPDRETLMVTLLREFDRRVAQWRIARGRAELADAYRSRSVTIGSQVRAELAGGEQVTGLAVDVDDAGRLAIETSAGVVSVSAGDVTHLLTS